MPFDLFELRDQVVGNSQRYFSSFINIFDERAEQHAGGRLDDGKL